jgi:SP family general alpha glucoside:H+ symporter-like MFS transporter
MGYTTQPPAEAPVPVAVEVELVANAQDAMAQEHELGFFEALRLYPSGVFWSVVMSTAVIMEGYDTKLIGTLFAQPVFQRTFGQEVKPGSYQISAPWQAGLSNGSTAGQLGGLLLAGWVSERYGFRKTIVGGLAVIAAVLFITFFAPNLVVLEVGQILLGEYGL